MKRSPHQTIENVVFTCTERKRIAAPQALHLGNIPGAKTIDVAEAWTSRLESYSGERLAAHDLYLGEHWSIVKSIAQRSVESDRYLRIWICSAGYGLIPWTAKLAPYNATFTRSSNNATPINVPGEPSWWSLLTRWRKPADGPRSFQELIRTTHGRTLMVLSAPYLEACREDIFGAFSSAGERLSILSVGTRGSARLSPYLLAGDGRLRNRFGGSMQALNARIAAYLLESDDASHLSMNAKLTQLLHDTPALEKYERKNLSDEEVMGYIVRRRGEDIGSTHSRLLRELRDSGFACEQRRFRELFALSAEQVA